MDLLYKLKRVNELPYSNRKGFKYIGTVEYSLVKNIEELHCKYRSYGNKFGNIYSNGKYYFIKGVDASKKESCATNARIKMQIESIENSDLPFYIMRGPSNYIGVGQGWKNV